MKPLRTKPALLVCLAALALTGCPGKKPPATVTPPPPSAAPQPAPQPVEAQPQTQTSQAPTQGTPPSDQGQAPPATEESKAKTDEQQAVKKKTASHPPSGNAKTSPETAGNASPKIIVKPDAAKPGPTPGQISPSLPQNEAAHDQATTEQVLQSAETNLSGIKRQLSQDEEAMVTQIKDYVNQSRQATKENDLVRAHNLATKARLLSDELAKRR